MTKYLISFIAFILLAGCASKKNDPSNIAYDFWLAEKEQKVEEAAKLTLKEDTQAVKLHQKIKIKDIDFQEAEIKGEKATIPTTLLLKDFSLIENNQAKVTFNTIMTKTDKGWRINMFETKKELYLEIGKVYAQTLGKDFANTIQNALGDTDQIKGIFQQLIKGLQKAVEKQNGETL